MATPAGNTSWALLYGEGFLVSAQVKHSLKGKIWQQEGMQSLLLSDAYGISPPEEILTLELGFFIWDKEIGQFTCRVH